MRVSNMLTLPAAASLLAAAAVMGASSSSSSSRSINPLAAPSIQAWGQQPLASPPTFTTSMGESLDNCKPTGQIDDARCDYETVEKDINTSNFFQTLSNLVKEKYFRYYKVDLYKDCPFWNENSLCMSRDCTVSKVDEFQIPVEYRTACLSSLKTTDEAEVLPQHADMSSALETHDHSAASGEGVEAAAAVDATCQCAETDFCHWEDEEWSPESLWVDLIDNPERFTGYEGPGAHRVWRSIYEENCFGLARPSSSFSHSAAAGNLLSGGGTVAGGIASTLEESKQAAEAFSSLLNKQSTLMDDSKNEQCLEKRVFYKIISGLHASISIHICNDYLDRKTGEWKPNLQCFVERIAQHPERLQNVYFNHVVLTRALAKLAERLGMVRKEGKEGKFRPRIDKRALNNDDVLAKLAPGLPSSPSNGLLGRLLQQSLDSPPTFDEASMFDKNNPESEFLRSEFRDKFRNVSRIMDCVGCDKCRLWGKLQVNGLGTALKILFEGSNLNPNRILQRSELVALVNTVHRISESIRAVESFRDMYQVEQQKQQQQQQSVAAASRSQRKVDGSSPSSSSQSASRRSNNASKPLSGTRGSSSSDDQTYDRASQNLLQRVMSVLERGRSACESQWRRCLSWCLTMFDQDNQSSKQKTEL